MEHQTFATKIKQAPGNNARVLRFVASTEDIDRDGDSISVGGWNLGEIKRNPVFAWSHNYQNPTIGKIVNIETDLIKKELVCDVQFPTLEELAPTGDPDEHAKFIQTIFSLYKGGYLNAVSVGCSYDESSPNMTNGYNVTRATLLEISGCVLPSNANALRIASSKGNIEKKSLDMVVKSMKIESKGAIPFHAYPLADEGAKWDGPAVIRESEIDDLKKICAFVADKKPEDLTKGDFKLPHHLTRADGYKTVKKGVVAAVGAIMGARGGVNIPEADKEAVKAHLKKHYKEFELDWPEDKSAWAEQCKSLGINFINTKGGARLSATTHAHIDNIEACMKELDDHMANMKACHGKAMKCIQKLRDGDEPDGQEEPDDSSTMASDDKDVIGGVYPENPAFTDEGFINVDFSQ